MRFSFDCIFYYVTDIDRAVLFYSSVLGMRLTSRDLVARFDIDGVLFELVPAPAGQKPTGKGNARLCLRVDDIEETRRGLEEKNVGTSEIQDLGKGLLSFLEDPDGNEICLWQYRPA